MRARVSIVLPGLAAALFVTAEARGQPAGDRGAPPATAADSAGIRSAALDYIDGWYAADGAQMTRALHPELAKRNVTTDPASGRSHLTQMTAMTLVQSTERGGGSDMVDEGMASQGAALVIEAREGRAAARGYLHDGSPLFSARGFCHLWRVGGDERLMNDFAVLPSYAKGPWVYEMLRDRLGDSLYLATLRAFVRAHPAGEPGAGLPNAKAAPRSGAGRAHPAARSRPTARGRGRRQRSRTLWPRGCRGRRGPS